MQVYIGADHGGFKLKKAIKKYLESLDIDFEDLGNKIYDKDDDYPDYSYAVASRVAINPGSFGILICGSSFGACIVANKVKGIRAVSIGTALEAKLARSHDNANVLCLAGGDIKDKARGLAINRNLAKKIIDIFLKTKFSKASRHLRRLNKLKQIEKKNLF